MSLCLSVYVCPGIVLFCVPNIYINYYSFRYIE